MKLKITILATVAVASLLAACGGTANNANTNANRSNTMTNLGANNANANVYVTNANTAPANRWNANISREEYEKNRAEYEKSRGSSESIGQSLEDSWLWFKTKSALMTTSDLRDSTINVDVANGVITLKGTVANAAQKTKAKQVADGIQGKKSVVDQLKIAPSDSMTNMGTGNTKSTTNKK